MFIWHKEIRTSSYKSYEVLKGEIEGAKLFGEALVPALRFHFCKTMEETIADFVGLDNKVLIFGTMCGLGQMLDMKGFMAKDENLSYKELILH